jgi:bifunctional non-homologous end joining protein LigD
MKIAVTNKNKVFFQNPKTTKGDIVSYYKKISKYILPHIANRPINLYRAPDGILGEGFFQQNMPVYFPSWIDFFDTRRISGGYARHVLVNKSDTLVYLANEGVVTLHIWNSRTDNINNPDRIVFDLDPPNEKVFKMVFEVAFLLKKVLERLGIVPYVMTTGSKGVHIIVPIKPDSDFKKVKSFAKKIVEIMEILYPDMITSNFLKSKRTDRVFIDYLRNNYGQTAVAPYSVRLKEGAPIACPIFWSDLAKKEFGPQSINTRNIFRYLKKGDPWRGMYRDVRSVKYYQGKLGKILG